MSDFGDLTYELLKRLYAEFTDFRKDQASVRAPVIARAALFDDVGGPGPDPHRARRHSRRRVDDQAQARPGRRLIAFRQAGLLSSDRPTFTASTISGGTTTADSTTLASI